MLLLLLLLVMPTMLQQYEAIETLAPALFGQVLRCRDAASGASVAVKRMELAWAAQRRAKDSDRVVEEDVFTEMQVHLRVRALGGHPHVLPALDCAVEDGVAFLVTKLCARGELLTVLNAQRATLSTPQLMRYFRQVVRGAAFLHANGIAHRDLSLENVLVDDDDCCQITDFGLATFATPLDPRPVGKILYMAPEACIVGGAPFDPAKADVWALGVMLFAMIAGQYPFAEPQRRDARFRLLADLGLDYLLAKCDVDTRGKEAIVDLLRQLLVVDPAQRPTLAALLHHEALRSVAEADEHVPGAVDRLPESGGAVQAPARRRMSATCRDIDRAGCMLREAVA